MTDWTDARVDLLKRLWERGLPAHEIARHVGDDATKSAVIGKAHTLGLEKRSTANGQSQWRFEEIVRLFRLRKEDVSFQDMGEAFPGRSVASLRVRVSKVRADPALMARVEHELAPPEPDPVPLPVETSDKEPCHCIEPGCRRTAMKYYKHCQEHDQARIRRKREAA